MSVNIKVSEICYKRRRSERKKLTDPTPSNGIRSVLDSIECGNGSQEEELYGKYKKRKIIIEKVWNSNSFLKHYKNSLIDKSKNEDEDTFNSKVIYDVLLLVF